MKKQNILILLFIACMVVAFFLYVYILSPSDDKVAANTKDAKVVQEQLKYQQERLQDIRELISKKRREMDYYYNRRRVELRQGTGRRLIRSSGGRYGSDVYWIADDDLDWELFHLEEQRKADLVDLEAYERRLKKEVSLAISDITSEPETTYGVVTAIFETDGSPSALIDGIVVREGHIIHGVKVLDIQKDKVEFADGRKKRIQRVDEEPNPPWKKLDLDDSEWEEYLKETELANKQADYERLLKLASKAEADGELQTALNCYIRAQDCTDESLQERIDSLRVQVWLDKARVAEDEGKLSDAVNLYENIEKYTGEETHQDKINSLRSVIDEEQKQKKFAWHFSYAKANDSKLRGTEALQSLRQALELEPNNSEALELRTKIEQYYDSSMLSLINSNPGDTHLEISSYEASELKELQQQTAARLGLQVEKIISLGNKADIEFVLVPAGEFIMGSEESAGPAHAVKITKPYYISKYEVTQRQWEKVMGNNPSHFKAGDPKIILDRKMFVEDPNLPVDSVSWDDAVEFCTKLSEAKGLHFYLPTEAQWEHACRAGTKSVFYFGDDQGGQRLQEYAWYSDNSYRNTFATTHPAGQKIPNGFGLYDMYGNVCEWCCDWYEELYYSRNISIDPLGPPSGLKRVARGGCYNSEESECSSASRWSFIPSEQMPACGFRIVMDLE